MRRIVPAVLMLAVVVALPVQAEEHAHTVVVAETLTWVEPATLPGARLAVVQGDPSKEGLFVYRLKMSADYRIPPHLHKASENVTVLSGVFVIGVGEKFDQGSGQELPVGGFVSIPPNHPHFAWVGDEIEGVGHMGPVIHPDRVNAMIERYLTDGPPTAQHTRRNRHGTCDLDEHPLGGDAEAFCRPGSRLRPGQPVL